MTGVVLRGEAADERVEFIEVRAVNWTSSELVITGRRDEGGIVETASFPLEQIRYVLVRDFSARESLKKTFWTSAVVTFLVYVVLCWAGDCSFGEV